MQQYAQCRAFLGCRPPVAVKEFPCQADPVPLNLPTRASPLTRLVETSLEIGRTVARRVVDNDALAVLRIELEEARKNLIRTPGEAIRAQALTDSLQAQGVQDVLTADRISVELGIAMRGIFIDAYRMIALLRDLPPHMIHLTNECFRERHGVTIESAVATNIPHSCGWARTMGYGVLKRRAICEFTSGKQVDGHATELALLITRKALPEIAEFFLRHRSKSPEILRSLCLNHGPSFTKESTIASEPDVALGFERIAATTLTGDNLTFVSELSRGHLDRAYAALLHSELTHRGLSSRAYRCAQCLLQVPIEVQPYVTAAYSTMYRSCPVAALGALHREDKPNPLVDIALCSLRDDTLGVRAARLAAGFQKKSEEWYASVFIGHNYAENMQVIRRFEDRYAVPFWKKLEDTARSSIGIHLVRSIIRNGMLDRAEIIRDSIRGFGAYSKGVVDALAGLSPGQIQRLEVEYKKLSHDKLSESVLTRPMTVARKLAEGFVLWVKGKTTLGRVVSSKNLGVEGLEEELESELSGDSQVDALLNLNGSLPTPESHYFRIAAHYAHERSRRLQRLVNFLNVDASIIDRDFDSLSRHYRQELPGSVAHVDVPSEQLTASSPSNKPAPWSGDHLLRFTVLSKLVENSFESVRRTRQFSSNFVATQIASGIGAATFIGAPLLLGFPLSATIALTGAASVVARAYVKHLFNGAGYGRVELVHDSFFSAAAGIGRSSQHVLKAFRFTQTLAGGSETRVFSYAFSWLVNKIASVGESFGLNRKPLYLEHVDREAKTFHSEYSFSAADHVARHWDSRDSYKYGVPQ